MVELSFEDEAVVIPELKDLVEGTVEEPGVVKFDPDARTLVFGSSNNLHKDRRFRCYVRGHLDVSSY